MCSIPSSPACAAVLAAALLSLAGCAAPSATASRVAVNACDTNDGFAITGVVHAATKRDVDDCRRMASRPDGILVSRGADQP